MMHKSLLELTFHLPRSYLQEMCLIKVITILCNKPQLLGLILRCNFQTDSLFRLCARKGEEWEAVEAMAKEMVSQICNSVLLKKSILEFLWPTSYRIMLWKSIYAPSFSNTFLQHFYWTDRGRIDNTRTARYIIGNKNIPVRKRFVLACSVCLSKEIHETWREMSIEDEAYFFAGNREKIRPLLLFWAHTLQGSRDPFEVGLLMNRALKCATEIRLLEAVKYLFAISTEVARIYMVSSSIVELIKKNEARIYNQESLLFEEDDYDIGSFLFSEMSDSVQEITFNLQTSFVLSLLFHSSKYKLFFSLWEERLEPTSVYYFVIFLHMIFYTYHLEVVNDDDCRKLFIDVYRMIPTSRKSSICLRDLGAEFLSVLIRDNFPFILETEAFQKIAEFTSIDLKFSTSVQKFDFHQGKWKLLHFLIEEKIVTIPTLLSSRMRILTILKIGLFNEIAWNNILKFVQNVLSKNSQQKV